MATASVDMIAKEALHIAERGNREVYSFPKVMPAVRPTRMMIERELAHH